MNENTSLSTFKESLKVNDLIWLVLQQAGEIPSSSGGKSKNVVVLKNTYNHRKSCFRILRQDSDTNRRNQRRNSKKATHSKLGVSYS